MFQGLLHVGKVKSKSISFLVQPVIRSNKELGKMERIVLKANFLIQLGILKYLWNSSVYPSSHSCEN